MPLQHQFPFFKGMIWIMLRIESEWHRFEIDIIAYYFNLCRSQKNKNNSSCRSFHNLLSVLRSSAMASALATIIYKYFLVKSQNATAVVERYPHFVAKDTKSKGIKFLKGNKKVLHRSSLANYPH